MHTINVTVNIVTPRPETEGERVVRCARAYADFVNRGIKNHITAEQKKGNALFMNIATHEQYLAACAADEKRKRKELGFWRYHFGQ